MDTNKSICLGKTLGQDSGLVTPAIPSDCNLVVSGFLQRVDGLADRLRLRSTGAREFTKVLSLLCFVPR